MKYFITLFTILLLFSACTSQKQSVVASKKELPEWYKNPAKTNASTMYSMGEGESKAEAVAVALSAMASTLSVSISSEFKTKSIVQEGDIESSQTTSTNEVKSDVKKIRISNYEVVEVEEIGFKKFIVLVKSEKKKLFESLKKELEQKITLTQTRATSNALKELGSYKEQKNLLQDVPNIVTVMGVLNEGFDGSKYIKKIQEVDERYEKLLSSITFSVESDKESQNLKAPIQKGLSAKKLTIKESGGKNHFKIYITSKTEQASSYGFSLARCAIQITIKESSGAIIGSNKLNITGQSTQGYNIAKESIAIKLNEMIKKEGIEKVLGLEI
ncbi:MAG: LPP20 family lipoprotein [Sulfurimonas sp.]|nr:LPP20 family lipoprotein [Sulfurimonas sp.]